MQKRTFIKSLAAVTALSAIVLLTGCDEEKAVAEKPFRVGVTAGPHAAIVTEAAKVAAKNGLKVEVVEFTDYVTPDTALNDGALDAAVYQHEPFLLNFNKQKGTKLANVGNAVVQPMGFYSNKVKSIADIPEGAVISVPNDPTNCGRGLLLLQAAGLIKLPEGMGSEASLADIVENKRNLKIRELEAAQLPRSLDDALVAAQWQGRCHPSGTESDRPLRKCGKDLRESCCGSGKKVNREEFPPFGSATAAKISRHVSYEEPCRVPGSRHSKYPLSV